MMTFDSIGSLPFTALALVSVLVLAWFVVRVLARLGVGKSSNGNSMRVIQSTPVGARERVVLLQFDGKQYLLGVTAGGISVLERHIVSAPDETTRSSSNTEQTNSKKPGDTLV